MNKVATVGQLIVAVIALILSLITSYVAVKVNDKEQDVKIQNLETRNLEMVNSFEKFNLKLDQIQNSQTQILIQLQDKQDRPDVSAYSRSGR
jgi:Trk K+ transport system NAD-binding subunit